MMSTKTRLAAALAAACLAAFPAPAAPPPQTEDSRIVPAGGTARQGFGTSVAMAGTTAVVGAPGTPAPVTVSGAAYVLTRGPGGVWTQTDRLFASAAPADDMFGQSVSISGDRILVGSPFAPDGLAVGEAHVFVRDPGGAWTREAILTASDAATNTRLGSSVALDGDTAAVFGLTGAGTAGARGGVYVFTRGPGGWSQQQILVPEGGIALGINESRMVSLSGDMIAAGAPFDHTHGHEAGAVYIFRRGSDGVWTQDAALAPADIADHHLFGASVELVGNAVLVGAPDFNYPFAGLTGGSAYVFTRDAGGHWHEGKLPDPAGLAAEHLFGRAVAFDGTTALVGQATSGSSGWVHVYRRGPGGAWAERARLVNTQTDAAGLGFAVGVADGWGIMGTRFDHEVALYAGAALSYRLDATCPGDLNRDGIVDALDITIIARNFGRTGADAAGGDLNGDGMIDFGDVVALVAAVGSPCEGVTPARR